MYALEFHIALYKCNLNPELLGVQKVKLSDISEVAHDTISMNVA
jgi:hypothetical protein